MASIATISAATDRIKCQAGSSAQHVFVVKNTSARALTVGVQIVPEAGGDSAWYSLEGETERQLAPEESDKYAVNVKPPDSAEPATCTLHLLVYDTAAPGEDFSKGPTVQVEVEKKPEKPPEPAKKFPWWILIVVLAVLGLVGAGVAYWLTYVPSTKVPDLSDQRLERARELIELASLKPGEVVNASTGEPATSGTVVDQSPEAGAEVDEETVVDMVVEPPLVTVTDVRQKTEAEAKALLEADGLDVGEARRRPTNQVAAGTVIDQDPQPGTQVAPGHKVSLTVAEAEAVKEIDLTGVWNSNDRGSCYLRQSRSTVVWYCERDPETPSWSNVFLGRIRGDIVEGNWVDVPKGRSGNRGVLRLKVSPSGNDLSAVERTGGYGGSKWTRVK